MTTYVLVPGAWLGGWCWQPVARRLRAQGHEVYPVTLTGLGERAHLARPETDLETHIADVVNLIDYEELVDVVLVGHSYAGVVVAGVADRRPDRIAQLVYLDTTPGTDGVAVLDLLPPERREHVRRQVAERGDGWRWPLPADDELEQIASLHGMDAAQRQRLRATAAPHAFGTYTQPLRLSGPPVGAYRRVGIVCSQSFITLDQLRAQIASGAPQFQALAGPGWRFHELATGHWPMFSTPDALADLLHSLAQL